jgi:predicted secreted Zn-dependent protease
MTSPRDALSVVETIMVLAAPAEANGGSRMFEEMKTYKAVGQNGETVLVSAYTESEARQKAEEELGWGNVIRFKQV